MSVHPETDASQRITAWRYRHGLDAKETARRLRCSRQALHNWETGKTRPPYYILLALRALEKGLKPI